MGKTDNAYVYLYDIFEKNHLNEIINKLDKIFGKNQPEQHTSVTFGEKEQLDEKRHVWIINDLEKLFAESESIAENQKMSANPELMKKSILDATVVVTYHDKLPYFVMVMLITVDTSIFEETKLISELQSTINPLKLYFDKIHGGIFKEYYLSTPGCFSFIYFQTRLVSSEFIELFSMCSKLQINAPLINFEQAKQETIQASKMVRSLSPFNSISDHSIISLYTNRETVIQFVGSFEWLIREGIRNTYAVTIFPFDQQLPILDKTLLIPKLVLSGSKTIYPEQSSGAMIYLLGSLTWARYVFKKLENFDEKINELKTSQFQNLKEKQQIPTLNSLHEIRSRITSVLIDIRILKRTFQFNIETFRDEKFEKETILLHSDEFIIGSTYKTIRHTPFFHLLLQKIEETIDNYKELIEQRLSETEKIYENVSNVVKLQEQERGKRLQRNLYVVSVLALVVAGLTFSITVSMWWSGNELSQSVTNLVNVTENLVDITSEARNYQKANLENQLSRFSPELKYGIQGIGFDQSKPNSIWYYISSMGDDHVYVKHKWTITGDTCTKDGQSQQIAYEFSNRTTMDLTKEDREKVDNVKIPDEFFTKYMVGRKSFLLQLELEMNPYTNASGPIESIEFPKKTFIQYDLNEERRGWMPWVNPSGMLNCTVEPSIFGTAPLDTSSIDNFYRYNVYKFPEK